MTTSDSSGEPSADLATMLAEMDSRLQALQRELEEVAVPITRRGVRPPGVARPVVEQPAQPSAAAALDESSGYAPADAVPAAPAAPTAPVARPRRPPPVAPEAVAAPDAPPPEPPPAPRPRGRRITAVEGSPRVPAARPQPVPAGTPPSPPPGGAARPTPAAGARSAPHGAGTATSDALVRETILQAEEEARAIVGDARHRIAAIGARTRALLEQALTAPAPAPEAPAARPAGNASPADEMVYDGTVTVEAGPFDGVAQLKAFEDALASIPGVEDVYIRTFERYYAHFTLSLVAPTRLIAELRTRTTEPLRVIDESESGARLEIVRNGSGATS